MILESVYFVVMYRLKFTQLSKYSTTMPEDSRSKMHKFVVGIFDIFVK